ncbi:MAG: alpha/beta hydrolase family protein [Sphingobacteriales bacterium]
MCRSVLVTRAIIISTLSFFVQQGFAQNIGERTFRFMDTARNRPVITEVWYSTTDVPSQKSDGNYPFIHIPTVRNATVSDMKFPLILISHGTGGGRMTLEWLADILVKNGFIVAAVDHYGNTYDNKIAADFIEPWRRPLDISYALSALLKETLFGSRIDTARIGAAGFSIGGYTVIALAGGKLDLNALKVYLNTPAGKKEAAIPEFPNLMSKIDANSVARSFNSSPPLKDSRIKAFFAICPAIGQGFVNKEQFAAIQSPVYIVGAQSDSIAPVKTNAKHYHELIKGSKLMVTEGKIGHYVFLNEATDAYKRQAPFIFTDDVSVNRRQVHERVGQSAVEFFKSALK